MAIFSAIATAIAGALFAGSTLAATIIGSGLAFATQLGFQYLNRPKKRKYTAVQGETQFGGDVPVGAFYGTGKTKGQRAFYAKWDKGNKYNAEVFILANGWCDGLEPYIYLFGEKRNLLSRPVLGNEAARYYIEGFTDNNGDPAISIRFYDGRPGQGVDQRLVNFTANLGSTWKNTSINAGLCYVIVERYYSDRFFGGKGKPEVEFVLRGLKEYDPRKDATLAGGAGPQRLDDPSTWVHTLNPAVHRLNYQLGLKAMISGRTLIGEGKTLGQLDLGSYFAAMNVCDALRTDGKKRYQCSLFVTGEDDHTEILKEFDDAMAGYGLNRRGLSGVIPGAPQIPVLEITAADIPVDRAKEIQFRKSAFDRYNHLSGQFLSIEANWNPESLTPVYVNADVATDGRNRQTSNDFLQVTDPDIAQYLLNIRYRQNRKGGTATLPVSRRVGLRVQEGEWVVWRGKEWMISEWVLDEQFRITLKLSEAGADIYDDEDIEPGPVVIPPTPNINPSMLFTVQNFNVTAGMITGAGGHDVPCLVFTWTPPQDPTIVAVRIFFRQSGQLAELLVTCTDPESGKYTTTDGIVSGTIYDAHATITTVPDRLKTFTPWATTATETGEVYLPGMVAGLQTFVDGATLWIRDGVRQTILDIQRLSRLSLDQDFTAFKDRQTIRREIASTTGANKAFFLEQIDVATGPSSSLARRMTVVEATLPGISANAKALDLLSVRVATTEGKTDVLAQSITDLSAVVADKVGSTAFAALTSRVTTEEGKSTAQAADIVDLQSQINGKASASAVSLLQTQVNTVETTADSKALVYRQTTAPTGTGVKLRDLWIKSNSGNIIYVCTATGAVPTWTLSEDQRIPTLVTDVQATADAITSISAGQTTGDLATANFRMGVSAGPAGYSSRIAMEARTGGAGAWRSAGLFIDVPASTGTPTRIVLQADQIAMTNGATVKNPFVFESGVLYLDEINVKQANITNLVVTTSNIAAGAVSGFYIATSAPEIESAADLEMTLVVPHGTGSPRVLIFANGKFRKKFIDDFGAVITVTPGRAGSVVSLPAETLAGVNCPYTCAGAYTPASATASTTFTFNVSGRGYSRDREIYALVMKR